MFFITENRPPIIGQRLSADFLLGALRSNIFQTFDQVSSVISNGNIMYLRFESYLQDRDYKFRLGIFQAAFNLRDNEAVADYARNAIREDIEWYKENLPSPDEYYFYLRRHKTREALGVCWFKYQASEMIRRAYIMKDRLEEWGYPIFVIKSRKPGRIKYQDDYQVVVNPYQ